MLRKAIVLIGVLAAVGLPATARYRLLSGAETISYADFIAVVDVATPLNKITKADGDSQFGQRAEAKIQRVLKGIELEPKTDTITLLGDLTGSNGNKLCLPDIHLSAGKHLVFLKKTPSGYVTAGGGITFAEIKDNKVTWYTDAQSTEYKASSRSLDLVIADIRKLLKPAIDK